ncbi:MAG: hypothetical protein GY906_39760 [bacterium]|nr:hypothetical protein [bacterium]
MDTAYELTVDHHQNELSRAPTEWPGEARDAYRKLLAELNDWSRQQGCSSSSNQWVAMCAVREVWATPYTVQ